MANDWLTTTLPGTGRAPARPTLALWFRVRYRLTPWWARVLLVFVVSRVITTAMLLVHASWQQSNAWTGSHPGYLDFARIWDGHWYFIVAAAGYPAALPVMADGHIGENAWAFMPAYPALVRFLMFATGLDYDILAVFVAVVFAAATALLFYRLMARMLPPGTALFAVVLFCFAPVSPILQVTYAESMFAFFLTLGLYLLVSRNYLLLIPTVVVLSLTRPGGLAFALALGLHVAHRWWSRERDPFPPRERVSALLATGLAVAAGLCWPVIAWVVTGVPGAYTQTELAWRAPYVGYGELFPFVPWVQGANWWLPGGLGLALLFVLVVGFAALMFTPAVRRLGVDIRFWLASFVLYILAVFFPQSSTFRILLPTFPLLGAVAIPRSPIYRIGVIVLFIALQWGWIHISWWVDGADWTPP